MAWNKLNFRCGHNEDVQLYGKMVDRERIVEGAKRKLCPDCYKKEQAQKTNEAFESTNMEVCELTKGSEKQINWADKIRKEHLLALSKLIDILNDKDFFLERIISNKFYTDMFNKYNGENLIPALIDFINNKIEKLSEIDDAKTIIDNRNDIYEYENELYNCFVEMITPLLDTK